MLNKKEKTIMKKVTFLIAVFIVPLISFSQGRKFEYTPKVKNRVEITNLLGEISLQNASGNAIIIESDFDMERPERAEGLKLLGAMEDNTDLGVSVSENDGVVTISGVTKQVKDFKYTISVPQGIAVSIDYHSPFASSDVNVDSYKGSLEIKTLSAKVKLTECTGPFTVNSISGNVEVVYSSVNQDDPSSLASVSGLIDVTVPASSKATFEISNITGNVYNNLDLINSTKEKNDERAAGLGAIKHNSDNSYTLNGGGQKIYLKSVSGNIYLRKK
jgi:lia operon protein LiaG